jgi:hypothetical protein
MNKKPRSSIFNLLQKWAPKVFNPQKTKSFPPSSMTKNSMQSRKGDRTKGNKRKGKKEERNLVSVIQDHHAFSSPPLTPSFPFIA